MASGKHTIGFRVGASITGLATTNISVRGSFSFGEAWDPVTKEMAISHVGFGSTASCDNLTMTIDVFFERTGPIGSIPVIAAATHFADKAQAALDGFKAIKISSARH